MYLSTLTTAEAVSRQLIKVDPATSPSASQSEYNEYYAYLVPILKQISQYIASQTNNAVFVPYTATHDYYFREMQIPPRPIVDNGVFPVWLNRYLISASEVEWLDTALTANTQYRLTSGRNATSLPPYDTVTVSTLSGGLNWPAYFANFTDKVAITGVWCYHTSPSMMFDDTTTLSAAITTTSATTCTVASGTSIETLSYILIDNELMQVTAKSTNTLTLKRGVNGYTAATHLNGATVKTFIPMPDISLIATRLAALMYERRTDVGTALQVLQSGVNVTDKPLAVTETLMRYRDLHSWGVVV